MAIVRKMIYENEPLTAEQLKQIEEAEKKPIVFDADCLELTEQQLKEITAMAAQQRRERRKQLFEAQATDVNYYLDCGCDQKAAAYFASGRKTITSVTANADYTLLLTFDNGEKRLYDTSHLFTTGSVFNKIKPLADFKRVYLDESHCVSWDIDPNVDSKKVWSNKLDLCPDSCYLDSVLIEK